MNCNVTTPSDSQLLMSNDYYRPLSNPTRLESLKLINEALRRFTALETTLLTQRKQSQMTNSMYMTRSRFNSVASTTYSRINESIITKTQA